MSHTQRMEHQLEQNGILTKEKQMQQFCEEENVERKMTLSLQDVEEFCAYKRRRKLEEINTAVAKSEATLLNGEDPQRVCERAVRLKQAAIKVYSGWLAQAKTYLGKDAVRVKLDCVIGVGGETLTKVKMFEIREALKIGASELTIVVAPSLLASGRFTEIKRELVRLRAVAKKATVKVWVDKSCPRATLSRVARLCGEVGIAYFCVPYFDGCERLRFELTGGCRLEVSEVERLQEFRRLSEVGVGRIVTRNIWGIYAEWMKEVDSIEGLSEENKPKGNGGLSQIIERFGKSQKEDKIMQEKKKNENSSDFKCS